MAIEKFGISEAKEFCENHEDPRVQLTWRMLCGARSKNAQWCEALNKANDRIRELEDNNEQLREELQDRD